MPFLRLPAHIIRTHHFVVRFTVSLAQATIFSDISLIKVGPGTPRAILAQSNPILSFDEFMQLLQIVLINPYLVPRFGDMSGQVSHVGLQIFALCVLFILLKV
jgi:hypothetical protein